MKKIITLTLFVLFTGLFALPVKSQTIKLVMNKAGLPSIRLDNQKLTDGQTVPLKLTDKGLTITLDNKIPGNSLVSIVGTGASSTLKINGLEAPLSSASLVTDNQLQLALSPNTYDLNQPFSVDFISAKDHSKSMQVNFTPSLGNAGDQGNNANAQGSGSGNTIKADPVYHPGSAVYDALSMADPSHMTLKDLKAIIHVYFPKAAVGTPQDLVDAVQGNPFLKPIVIPSYVNTPSSISSQSGASVSSGISLSSIGGLDVSTITDGLAKFLVKRVKEELSTAFFDKLKTAFKADSDLTTLFPKTAALLNQIDADVYDYKSYIQNLREAFKNDLDALDSNLPGILPNHKTFFTTNPSLADAIISGSYMTKSLRSQTHPGDVIANFPLDTIRVYQKDEPAWIGVLQTLQLLSASARDTIKNGTSYWVNINYLRQVAADKTSLRIYLGLLLQQAQNQYNSIPFDGDSKITLVSELTKVAATFDTDYDTYNAYKQYLMNFAVKADAINKMIQSYQKPANDSLAVELYKKYFDVTADLFEYSMQVTKLKGMEKLIPSKSTFTTQYPVYLKVMRSVSDLAVDINRKGYPAAINQTVTIYSELASFAPDKKGLPVANFVKYGSFMAAVATAKTSDEVESTIEAFVLPAGSYSVKRESPFNVAINAYTGLFIGHEAIQGIPSKQFLNSYGLTAPIGVSVSLGERKFFNPFSGNGHASYSLFISLIDIGAVAAYRFKDDTTSQVPKIQLKNIFSPGAFLSIGIPKTPLSLNFGAQVGPNLREIDNNNTSEPSSDASNRIYWRFSAGLVVDIPLLNLHTQSK